MTSFEPAYSREALAALLATNARNRRLAQTAIDHLCRYPVRHGDYSTRGPDHRECQILLLDTVLLTYWVDDAVGEVRIVCIEWTA